MAPLYDKIERRQAADYFSRAKGGSSKGKLSVSDLSMANRLPRKFLFLIIDEFRKKRIGLICKIPLNEKCFKSVTTGKFQILNR
jgi:hypothetical protein